MEITAPNSGRIFDWCQREPSDSYIKQEFTRGFEDTSCSIPRTVSTTLCPHCYMLPRYPLVLKCGHLSCHRCFGEAFKRKDLCNHCRAAILLDEVFTLNEERVKRPESMTAKMYAEAKIKCTNIGCVKELDIDHINKHEFFECPFRLIKCPAKECYYKNNPTAVHKHSLQCPFQMYYCATCYGAYGMEVLVHSCTSMLRRRLIDSVRSPLAWVPEIQNHNTGDIILPPHVTHLPFDIDALSEAHADEIVRRNRRVLSLSSGAGLTGLAPQRRVLQRQHGLPRGLDEVDGPDSDQENDRANFNFN